MGLRFRGRSFSNSFASIPEVAPRGALVKIVFAGAHLRNSAYPSAILWPSDDDPNDSIATTPPCEVDNHAFKEPNASVMRLHQKRKLRRQSVNSMGSNNNLSEIDEKLTHNFELSGFIEVLGEDVETNCNFALGDRVLIYPYSGQTKNYCEYVCVPDVRHLVKLPEAIPLDGAASVVSGALYAFNLAVDIRESCKTLSEAGISPKVLIVGSKPLVLWTLSLLSYVFAATEEKPTLIIASQDEALLCLEKEFPQVKFVQWNKDAYDAVLVERTLEACRGKADIFANLESTPKMFQRALQCLRHGGQVFVLPETVAPGRFQLAAENNGFEIKVTENGTPQTYQEVLSLATTREIYLPSWEQFTVKDSRRVSELAETGLLTGNAVLRLSEAESLVA